MFLKLSAIMLALFIAMAPIASDAQMTLVTGSGDDAATSITLDSPEAVREAVSQMSDADVRKLLLERLDAVAARRAAKNQM